MSTEIDLVAVFERLYVEREEWPDSELRLTVQVRKDVITCDGDFVALTNFSLCRNWTGSSEVSVRAIPTRGAEEDGHGLGAGWGSNAT